MTILLTVPLIICRIHFLETWTKSKHCISVSFQYGHQNRLWYVT